MTRFRLLLSAALVATLAAGGVPRTFAQDQDEQSEQSLQELQQTANSQLQQQQFKQAAETFQKVVKLDKDNARAWHLLGYCLHSSGDLDAAIVAHKKAAEFDQTRGIALYNLGCAWSLKKDKTKAFKYLNEAIDAGFTQVSQFETDSDLDSLRKDKRFTRVMKRARGEEVEDDVTLAGSWDYVSGMRAGEKVDNARLMGPVTITDETFTLPAGPDDAFVMGYALSEKGDLTAIDLKVKSGPAPEGSAAMGIIKADGDKLTLCYDPMGQNRPTEFKSTAENGFFMFELKRRGFDAAKLVGTWEYSSGMRAGEKVTAERLAGEVKFTKDRVTIPASPTESFVMKYSVGADASPATIDLEIESGPVPEGKAIGIIRLEGDELTICYDPTGQARPDKFETSADDGRFLFTLKRKAASE